MQSLDLPVEDWDSLLSLAFGNAVVQIGYTDGLDTVALARTASMILAVGPDHRVCHPKAGEMYDTWHKTVTDAGIRGRVIGSFMPLGMILPVYQPDTFGLAVINPDTVADGEMDMTLTLAACCARRIAIVDPSGKLDMGALIERAVPSIPTTTVRSGALWVINTVPTDGVVMGVV